MQNNDNKKKKSQIRYDNPVETLKDLGSAGAAATADKLASLPIDFMNELLGQTPTSKVSGEISPGETMDMNEVYSGQHETETKLRKQVSHERKMRMEESSMIQTRNNELRMQLNAIQSEVMTLANKTENVMIETKIAAMQGTTEASTYDIFYFQNLLEFLRSFSKKIESAATWLSSFNKRSAKKNSWVSNYKKHGAKYLLSGEHYVSRNAG